MIHFELEFNRENSEKRNMFEDLFPKMSFFTVILLIPNIYALKTLKNLEHTISDV